MTCAFYSKGVLSERDERVVAVALEHLIQRHGVDTLYIWNMAENRAFFEQQKKYYPHLLLDEKTVCHEADYVLIYGMVSSNIHARIRYFRLG